MAIRGHNFFLFGLLALAILLLMPETAMAQVDLKDSGGSFTGLLDLIQQLSFYTYQSQFLNVCFPFPK